MQKNKLELLAPAGSWDAIKAAVENGCNAVYLGGKSFNARKLADNFDLEELENIIDYCHLRGVKVFITVNTLYKESELQRVVNFCSNVYAFGADAIIMQDIGVASFIKKQLPTISLHASTQMTAHSLKDAEFLRDVGFDRIVLSRELNLAEIREIAKLEGLDKSKNLETEIFVHGALCVCYSGQCLMSSSIGGRSGNRGRCAQPCRLPYKLTDQATTEIIKEGYLLSPKDMMALDILPEIVESGITSVKIEGRMKSPEYVGLVTKAYREKLDNLDIEKNPILRKELTQIFNRGGEFNEGYFKAYSGAPMMSIKTPKSSGIQIGVVEHYNKATKQCTISLIEPLIGGDGIEIWTKTEPHSGTNFNSATPAQADTIVTLTVEGNISRGDLVYKSYDKALVDKAKKLYEKDTRQIEIKTSVRAFIGEKLLLSVSYRDINLTFHGAMVAKSENRPLLPEELLNQIGKTGNTPFKLVFDKCEINENIFCSIKEVKQLRRDALLELEDKIKKSYKRSAKNLVFPASKTIAGSKKELYVLVSNASQLKAALSATPSRIYFEYDPTILKELNAFVTIAKTKKIELFAALLKISRGRSEDAYIDHLEKFDIDGYLVRTYGQLNALLYTEKQIVTDTSFNAMNTLSAQALKNFGAQGVTLSYELSVEDALPINCEGLEIVAYGYLPLMITSQCPVGNYAAGKNKSRFCELKGKKDRYTLVDRKNIALPIVTNCESCTATIFNPMPLFMLDKFHELNKINASIRMNFTWEKPEEVRRLIDAYGEVLALGQPDPELLEEYSTKGINYGHFFRGVQ